MRRTLLTLALIATAGVSYAQTMPVREPAEPNGRPFIGRNDFVRQPGDQPGPGGNAAVNYGSNVATAPATQPPSAQSPNAETPNAQTPNAETIASGQKTTRNNKLERGHATGPEPVPMDAVGPRQTAFKDEYGFRYDSQGNRLDARGNIISPHTPQH